MNKNSKIEPDYLVTKTITQGAYQAICAGQRASWGECTLALEDDHFCLSSPYTGRHKLLVVATDQARLCAHWAGFTFKSQSVSNSASN